MRNFTVSKHQLKVKICTHRHQITWNLAQMFPFMSSENVPSYFVLDFTLSILSGGV